jgi:hypothetical protein
MLWGFFHAAPVYVALGEVADCPHMPARSSLFIPTSGLLV